MCLKAYAGLIGEMQQQEVVAVWSDSDPLMQTYSSYMFRSHHVTTALLCHSGTIMTPNYVSNSSTEVSQWCTCDGSGNEWQGCQRILNMFSNNMCLREWRVPHLRAPLQNKPLYTVYVL